MWAHTVTNDGKHRGKTLSLFSHFLKVPTPYTSQGCYMETDHPGKTFSVVALLVFGQGNSLLGMGVRLSCVV